MKRNMFFAAACIAMAVLAAGCGNHAAENGDKSVDEVEEEVVASVAETPAAAPDSLAPEVDSLAPAADTLVVVTVVEEPVFDIVTNYGTIKVRLYADTPRHRDNFCKLANEGFYDGILFHRVINGFMIQTGDPLSKDNEMKARWGTGGPGYTIPAEFVDGHNHKKGALAAARMGDNANPYRESSGSQFYIVQDAATCAQLDGAYTVFGETLDGLKVIDDIAAVQTDARDCPLSPVKIIKIKPSKD